MSSETTVQGAAHTTRPDFKAQLAHYMAQMPESKQVLHRWMNLLEGASLTIVAGAFALALYLSINWTTVPQLAIPTAWIAFPVSVVPLMLLMGLHTIVLEASPPIALPGKTSGFATGSKAVWSGLGLIVAALAAGAFWGVLAWAVWSFDMSLAGTYARVLGAAARILGTALGVAIPVAIALSFVQRLVRFR